MRVMLTIPSLMPGGAERQLVALANGLHGRGHRVLVAALDQAGPLAGELQGPELAVLHKRGRADNLRVLARLAGLLRSFRPQAHYGFLPTPNLLGALLKPLFPGVALVMGVRASAIDFSRYDYGRAGLLATRLEAWASRLADAVAVNSRAGLALCLQRGFPARRCRVLPNGIDTARYHPDRTLGAELRARWGAGPSDLLIGLPARLDPIKDHPTFLRAAALLAQAEPRARFACIGGGPEGLLRQYDALARELGLSGRLAWTGHVTDMAAACNALDLACLSSTGEGFPNVLGEALACGVPCVSTEVGDAALVLGPAGALCPPGDPQALAEAMLAQLGRLEREGEGLRAACRERIRAEFSLERMVERTEALLLGLLPEGR